MQHRYVSRLFNKSPHLIHTHRRIFVAAREGSLPQFLSGVHTTYQTPLIAIVTEVRFPLSKRTTLYHYFLKQGFLTAVFIIIGDIDSLINAFSALGWCWYGFSIFGLIIMRLTRPHEPRPFKASIQAKPATPTTKPHLQ